MSEGIATEMFTLRVNRYRHTMTYRITKIFKLGILQKFKKLFHSFFYILTEK